MGNEDISNRYFTINEFSKHVGITAESLRHYDRKGVFRPIKHGVETKNNYRYYAPTQITTVKLIRVLTEIGVPLSKIKELSENRTPEALMKLLCKQKRIVADELLSLQNVYSVISTYLELLTEVVCAEETEISAYERNERQINLGGINDFSDSVDFYGEFIRFCNAQHEPVLNLSYPIGGYFDSMDTFINSPSRPTRFFSFDPKGYQKINKGLYLIGYTRGYYGQTNDLPARMVAYADSNELLFCGPVYNVYVQDEISIADPEQYLLQAMALVKETRRMPSKHPIRRSMI